MKHTPSLNNVIGPQNEQNLAVSLGVCVRVFRHLHSFLTHPCAGKKLLYVLNLFTGAGQEEEERDGMLKLCDE